MLSRKLLCDYINYNAPELHDLGDKLRAMIDVKYRFRHLGPDIVPSQITNIKCNGKYLHATVSKGIKGIPKYKIPNSIVSPENEKPLRLINSKKSYQEYILNLTSDVFFWDIFAIFRSNRHWMFAKISQPFELPKWIILDRYNEFINVSFDNSISCPVIQTEDTDYNIVLTPIDNDYIQDLIS